MSLLLFPKYPWPRSLLNPQDPSWLCLNLPLRLRLRPRSRLRPLQLRLPHRLQQTDRWEIWQR
jgi:hypothetical protein